MFRIFIVTLFILQCGCSTSDARLEFIKSDFPEIDLISIDGETLIKQGKLNRPLLLILFDNTCPHCVSALKDMEVNLFPYLNLNKLDIIGVGRGHDNKYLKKWLEQDRIIFKVVADKHRKIFNRFAKKWVPRVYLYNGTGKLTYRLKGWSENSVDLIMKEVKLVIGGLSIIT